MRSGTIYCIGLLANAGHGKTTAARYLADKYDAKIVSLAGPLKRVAQKVMGFSDQQLYGTQAEKEAVDPRYGFSARHFLRTLGTEGLREEFWPEVHLDAFRKSLEREALKFDHDVLFVCDDVRFPNEAEMLCALSPHSAVCSAVIKIVCTDAPPVSVKHASENSRMLLSRT
jgi:hypothetical protein